MDPTVETVRRLRLRSQRLAEDSRSCESVHDVVSGVCGLQAQAEEPAALAVRARSRNLHSEDAKRALYEERSIVRTWCMRGTLHLVATEDLPWLLDVFGPVYVARGRRRLLELGFDDDAADRAVRIIRESLADRGPLTRHELTGVLERAEVGIDPSGRALFHLLRRAALLGIAVQVGPKGGHEAYGLVRYWVEFRSPPDRTAALEELARRYLLAYQPATPADLGTWSGLPARDVRAALDGLSSELVEVHLADGAGVMLGRPDEVAEPAGLRLLGAFDSYLLGYENRAFAVPVEHMRRVRPGGGVIHPTAILDGRAVATWRIDRSRKRHRVVVEPFEAIGSELEALLPDEVADIGRFLGTKLDLA